MFHRKDNCELLTSNPAVGFLRCAEHYASWTSPGGIALNDVVKIEWHVSGVVDETYWYAAGLGLVRWLKHDGRESHITELIPRGSQEDNVRELIDCDEG